MMHSVIVTFKVVYLIFIKAICTSHINIFVCLAELKGATLELIQKLIREHARKKFPHLGL